MEGRRGRRTLPIQHGVRRGLDDLAVVRVPFAINLGAVTHVLTGNFWLPQIGALMTVYGLRVVSDAWRPEISRSKRTTCRGRNIPHDVRCPDRLPRSHAVARCPSRGGFSGALATRKPPRYIDIGARNR
jgi:hypothetical protein